MIFLNFSVQNFVQEADGSSMLEEFQMALEFLHIRILTVLFSLKMRKKLTLTTIAHDLSLSVLFLKLLDC